MAQRGYLYRKIAIDVICLVILSFAILFTYLFAVPFRRGFFCDDESIRHPHKPRVQVPDAVVASIALAVPLIIFTVLESVRHGLRTPGRYRIFGKTPPQWLVQLGTLSKVFLGGAAFNQITVDVGKYCLGRLRPHFLTVCLPDVLSTCITSTDHSYITDYLCTGADKDVIQEARLSFPSGHAALSFYSAIFTVAYLQLNMTWGGSKLLKHTLQFGLILLAWWTALTRVTDYMHHWSDVLAGVCIGTIVSTITVLFVSDITRKRSSEDGPELMVFMNKPNSVDTARKKAYGAVITLHPRP